MKRYDLLIWLGASLAGVLLAYHAGRLFNSPWLFVTLTAGVGFAAELLDYHLERKAV